MEPYVTVKCYWQQVLSAWRLTRCRLPLVTEPQTPCKSGAKKLFSGFLRRRGSRSSSGGGNDAALKTPPNSARV